MNFEEGGTAISWKEGRYLACKLYTSILDDLEDGEISEDAEDLLDWATSVQKIQNDYYFNVGALGTHPIFFETFETFLKKLRG